MVDSGGEKTDLLIRDAGPLRNLPRGVLHAVAKPRHTDGFRPFRKRDGVHRHRVDIVEQIRAGTHFLHRVEHLEQVFEGAQSPENPAWSERVGDDLINAVFHRNPILQFLMADRPGAEDGDDVIRPAQRLAQIGGRPGPEFNADLFRDQPGDGHGMAEPFGVDIHQHHFVRPQLRVHQDIFEKILGEDHAARSDQYDFRHGITSVDCIFAFD
ncbi:hypothetical protein SDC9_140709 [bioreactor metagenome]|uniref:Uncharacterized protein n=1 Tax=bioreactor metagenome TaxID=1076179 RepID=A0A645DVN4_9ZZZZ